MVHFSVFLNKILYKLIGAEVLTYFHGRPHGRWRFQLLWIDGSLGGGEGRVLCSTQDPNPSFFQLSLLSHRGYIHLKDFRRNSCLKFLFNIFIFQKTYQKHKVDFRKSLSNKHRNIFLLDKEAARTNFRWRTTPHQRQIGSRWWQLNPHSSSLKTCIGVDGLRKRWWQNWSHRI